MLDDLKEKNSDVNSETQDAISTILKFIFNEVNSHHQWIVKWSKTRDYLVTGRFK